MLLVRELDARVEGTFGSAIVLKPGASGSKKTRDEWPEVRMFIPARYIEEGGVEKARLQLGMARSATRGLNLAIRRAGGSAAGTALSGRSNVLGMAIDAAPARMLESPI